MACGIYEIVNTINQKRYIGSSKNIAKRWRRHREDLRKDIHHSTPLARAVDKYGMEAFEFRQIIECRATDLLFYEQCMLDAFKHEYNASPKAYAVVLSSEARAKLTEKVRAAWTPARRKAQARKARREAHARRVAGWVRPPVSDETRQKMQNTWRRKNAVHEAFGQMWSIKDLAEAYNVKYVMLRKRIYKGWPPEDAVLRPKRLGGS